MSNGAQTHQIQHYLTAEFSVKKKRMIQWMITSDIVYQKLCYRLCLHVYAGMCTYNGFGYDMASQHLGLNTDHTLRRSFPVFELDIYLFCSHCPFFIGIVIFHAVIMKRCYLGNSCSYYQLELVIKEIPRMWCIPCNQPSADLDLIYVTIINLNKI